MECNILIVGVGGQGTLLASRVLGAMASLQNTDCKLSEVHGMSQRGGSVVTHVRIGSSVCSPIISEGEADYILSFEKLEALRWCHYLKKDGVILVNDQEIMPMPVIIGSADYPQDIYGKLKELGKKTEVVEALTLAERAGNSKAVNVVMLGALTRIMNAPYDVAEAAMEKFVPAKFLEVNRKALSLGYGIDK